MMSSRGLVEGIRNRHRIVPELGSGVNLGALYAQSLRAGDKARGRMRDVFGAREPGEERRRLPGQIVNPTSIPFCILQALLWAQVASSAEAKPKGNGSPLMGADRLSRLQLPLARGG